MLVLREEFWGEEKSSGTQSDTRIITFLWAGKTENIKMSWLGFVTPEMMHFKQKIRVSGEYFAVLKRF